MIKINGEKNAKTRVKLRFGKTQVHKCKHTPVQGRIYMSKQGRLSTSIHGRMAGWTGHFM